MLQAIDLETSGMPKEELNKTRITELCLVAVKRQHLLDTRAGATPRVQHKLTLCLNPRRMISVEGTKITGLDNYLLEHEPSFNHEIFNMIDTFLSVLSQPVCLIAHNGLKFDFPILRNHLVKLNVNFKENVLCADCFHGFYHVLENIKLEQSAVSSVKEKNDQLTSTDKTELLSNVSTILPSEEANADFYKPNLSMQAVNETTPKSVKKPLISKIKNHKVKRKLAFPWGEGAKPSISYKLKDIYERVLNKTAMDAHQAENDCMFALEISAALSKQFVKWVDNNNIKLSDVEPMTVGVPM